MSSDPQVTSPTPAPVLTDDMTAKERYQAIIAQRAKTSGPTEERGLWKGGYSPKAMYGTWFISALVSIVALVVVGMFAAEQRNVWLITGAVLLLWWCIAIGMYLYRRLGVHYELTTQRFVHQVGVLTRQTDRIEVIDIDDVSYKQGIIQRILGVGTIELTGSDRSHPKLVMYGIDKVPEIASLIDDVRREERRRRSLHTIT